jgi:hypothetical protein
MSAVVLQAAQQALYAKLSQDTILMDMVGGVYDAVPQNAALPYVVLGDGAAETQEQLQGSVSTCELSLHVWTEGHGRKQALAILNRIHAVLHHANVSMGGYVVMGLRCVRAETEVDVAQERVYGQLGLVLTAMRSD